MLMDRGHWHELSASTREIIRSPRTRGGRTTFLREWIKYPMEYQAARWISGLPIVSIPQLLDELGEKHVEFPEDRGDRRLWNLGALEQSLLCQVVRAIRAQTVFEIGTFDGATTRLLAAALPDADGRVFTLDLPIEDYHLTHPPAGFDGTMVGERFRDTPEAARITQLRGDSLTFDFSPWAGSVDLVFVDAGHDYTHGLADSRSALQLVRPGGWIFWDDFTPRWHGLVRGVAEATAGRDVAWIEGTSFAVARG